MEQLYLQLKEQIARGLLFNSDLDEEATPEKAKGFTARFIDRLPYIKSMLTWRLCSKATPLPITTAR